VANEQRNALTAGYQLGEFTIERVLGAGGFGIAYLATEAGLDRKVAIKEYLPRHLALRGENGTSVHSVSDDEAGDYTYGLQRFREEAKALVAFRHPNIVAVHRFMEDNGTAYLVMEYVDGSSLAELLGDNETLTEDEVREIAIPLLDGLEQVHATGFLHRDIKPQNIFIQQNGNPVLIDFGAARLALGVQTQALTGVISSGYSPFEQYSKRGKQGPWTDIYALGATLYRSMTGEKPSEATDRIAEEDYKPISEVTGGAFSATLCAAVDKALALKAGDRPQSIAEWRAMFEELEDDEVSLQTLSDGQSLPETPGPPVPLDAAERQTVPVHRLPPEAQPPGSPAPTETPAPATPPDGTASSAPTSSPNPISTSIEAAEPAADRTVRVGPQLQEPENQTMRAGADPVRVEPGPAKTPPPPPVASARKRGGGRLALISLAVLVVLGGGAAGAWFGLGPEFFGLEGDGSKIASGGSTPGGASTGSGATAPGSERPGGSTAPASAGPKPGALVQDCSDCPQLVVLPAGSFVMGSPTGEPGRERAEGPQHRVVIPKKLAFGRYEVTFTEWAACLKAGGCGRHRPSDKGWGRGTRPVINVSWSDARAYVAWLSRKTGQSYRLPSESEWEYAARGGTKALRHWRGGVGNKRANCKNCGSAWNNKSTAPIGRFAVNPFGLYDMMGNVWEWVADCWTDTYDGRGSGSAPVSRSGACAYRVTRGGSFLTPLKDLRSAMRSGDKPAARDFATGFRVVREVE